MPTNDFLPFGSAVGANVSTQAEYAALAARSNGFSAGTAVSKQLNKAWRQSSVMATTLAQFISDQSGNDVLDDGNLAAIQTNLGLAIKAAVASGVPYATQAQVNAGASNTTVVNPKTLSAATQVQAFTAFTTTGSAPSFVLTPTPAITAYAISQRFQVTFNAAGGSTPTINVSGQGAKNIKQYNSTGGKIAASISTGQTSDIFYDGTDFVLLDQLPNSTGVTAAQFDNSLNLATTAFLQGVGLQFSGITGLAGTTTLTSAAAGSLCYSTSSTAFNVTLPSVSTMPGKTTITFFNFGGGPMTLVCSAGDGIYTNQIASTFQLVSGCSVTLVSNGGSAWLAVGLQNAAGVTGGFKNLTGSATGLSAVVTYTADELMVSNPAGFYQTLRSVSITPSLAASGVNGLDTGTSAVSTWYSVWVIWNGGTVAGLLSTSATSPTMPSGYTHKARVGWVRSDSTAGNKFPLSFVQSGRSVQYKVAAGSNVAAPIQMSSGTAGNPAANSWVAVSTSAFVCPTASRIFGSVSVSNGGAVVVAPNNAYSTMNAGLTDTGSMIGAGGSATTFIIAQSYALTLESANIYWASNLAVARLWCMGWEDNL